MFTIDKVLDEIMHLDSSERELLVEILNRRQIEERRKKYLRNFKKAQKDLLQGKIKPMSAKEAINHLHSI